ncbi:hypothetical protein AB0M36_22630 [Actinoplanes sp. NPDC051346]|uniref:hypothetical protein n=1 Tax=Actinoplanes sp. NPDC051346 TaxID=3155048 RepID=UPI00342F112D
MNNFREHPDFALLESLALVRGDFAIAGSGPLYVRGLIDDIGDVDVVARGAAWREVCRLGTVVDAPFSTVHRVCLFGGKIEVLDGWFPELWDVDQLIDGADVIDGFRLVRLDVVTATKRMLQRPRDRTHLELLAARQA